MVAGNEPELTLHIEYDYSKRFTDPLRQGGSFLGACRPNIRLPSIGKPGFRFWNPDFGFCNRRRNPFSDFTFEKSVLRIDFNVEIQIRISWISSLPFDREIRNWKDLQNCSRQERSFSLIMRARARPLFFRTVSFKSLFGFPTRTVKRKSEKQISQRWNPFLDFAFYCKSEIRILKSKSRFPNRTHPKYWTTSHFPFQHLGNENNLCPISTGCKKSGRNKLHLTAIKLRRQFIKSAMIEFFWGGRTCQRVIN